jgi:hypothetical protein
MREALEGRTKAEFREVPNRDNLGALRSRLLGQDGFPATVDQVRATVAHVCRSWPGTKYERGIKLTTILGDKFWTYHDSAQAETAAADQAAAAEAAREQGRKLLEQVEADGAEEALKKPQKPLSPALASVIRGAMEAAGSTDEG